MRRSALAMASATVVLGAAFTAPVAHAATCSDYTNQADAQRAADTRDADRDGIYCEALPCPCLRGGGGSTRPSAAPTPPRRKRARRIQARITSVIDGDTIRVRAFGASRSFYAVRLIGIDSPESHRPGRPVECGARRATAGMLKLAFTAPRDTNGDGLVDTEGGTGRGVTLTTDPTQATFDRYGRLLAYVDTRSRVNLQVEMLRAGLATVYVYGRRPFQRAARFRRAESRARVSTLGVWARCGGNFHKAA